MKRHLSFFFKLAASIGAFAYVLTKYPLEQTWAALPEARLAPLWWAVFLCFLVIVLNAVRWHAIIRATSPRPLPFFSVFSVNYIAQFTTLFLPNAVGSDIVRVAVMKDQGRDIADSLKNVLIDRYMGLLSYGLTTVLFIPFARVGNPRLDTVLNAALAVTAVGVLIFPLAFLVRKYAKEPKNKVLLWMIELFLDFKTLLKSPRWFVIMAASSIASNVLFCLCFFNLTRMFSIHIPLIDICLLIPLVLIAIVLPLSISGWGVREYSMASLFAVIGVPPAASVVLSIANGLLVTAVSLPGAFIWLFIRKKQ